MSQIPDYAVLTQITMPGTHDSMSKYGYGSECQNTTLTEQLNNGVRVFDIRLRYLPGADGRVNFSVHHSDEYQYAFFDSQFPYTSDCKYWVLDECLEFLKTHDRECIILLIKQEKLSRHPEDMRDAATFFDAFWKIVDNRAGYNGKRLDELFYMYDYVPPLAQVRGRIVFVFVDGDMGEAYRLSEPRWGLYWGNMDYQVDMDNPLPGQVRNLDVENHWSDLMDSKWGKVEAHLNKASALGGASDRWFVTYLSASRTPDATHFPNDYADYLLPKLLAYVQQAVREASAFTPAFFGIVMMDFPTQAAIDALLRAALQRSYTHYFFNTDIPKAPPASE